MTTASLSEVITDEQHSAIGGLGDAVSEAVAGVPTATPVLRLGVRDAFPKVGSHAYVHESCGLTPDAVATTVETELRRP